MTTQDIAIRIALAKESGELVVLRLLIGEQLTGQITALELRRVKLETGDGVEWIPIEDIMEIESPGV